jgi:CheY-like chemotaxis protein
MAEKYWILIAEDEAEVRELFRNAIQQRLESQGISALVVEANDGVEAMEKIAKRSFDCIVTDLRMPNMTGADMIKWLSDDSLNANTPIVVISAHVHDQFQPFCSEYDHVKFISKPCTPEEVAVATLKEIGYGKKDERISVHLMNPFLKAVQGKFSSNTGVSLEMHRPYIKAPGVPLKGSVHAILTLSSGTSKSNFCIGLDGPFFDRELAAEVTSIKEYGRKFDALARDLVQELVALALPHLKVCMGGQPRLVGMTQIQSSSAEDLNLKCLDKATCITVEVDTHQGKIYMTALSRKDFSMLRTRGAA